MRKDKFLGGQMSNLGGGAPPYNGEAERAYLCSVLLDPAVLSGGNLTPEDFYDFANRRIYEGILSLHNRGFKPDLITLKHELTRTGVFYESGGEDYITSIPKTVPSSANAEFYAEAIKSCSLRRGMLRVASKLGTSAHDKTLDEKSVIREAVDELISCLTA